MQQVTSGEVKDYVGRVYPAGNLYQAEMSLWGERDAFLQIRLDGKYSHLHGVVAAGENTDDIDNQYGCAVFSGTDYSDMSSAVFNSGPMQREGEPVFIDVDVTGLDTITIYSGNTSGGFEEVTILLSDLVLFE